MVDPSKLDLTVDRASDVSIGTQLVANLRAAMGDGRLGPGARLPSVRSLAEQAGVNVNTARAVYQRLEREGLARSEQGRGTFVIGLPAEDSVVRRELHQQIAVLEARLAQRPPLTPQSTQDRRPGGRLLSTTELTDVRDGLLRRLRELEVERADVLQRLTDLDIDIEVAPAPARPQASPPSAARHSNVSLRGARVRWTGA